MIGGATKLVALLGQPVAESLSPRMQNAAFAARALDWAYVPLEVEPAGLREAVAGLVAGGYAGANVTIPHKQAVVELCDEVEDFARRAGSVNTLVIREERVQGSSTDGAVLDGVKVASAAVVGAGGSAKAFVAALEDAGANVSVFSRRGAWPPQTEGAELVVHATPVRDETLFEPRAGQLVIDLAYRPDGRPTALVEAARAARAEVIDGLEVLLRQGAASFERWTGVEAPVDAMRAALGLRA
ncbi:MAG: shikimate dehydrogenase [Actinomycetota bacterium]|nr:shikimate dehydrogenase [Actinomycetota bacterium]